MFFPLVAPDGTEGISIHDDVVKHDGHTRKQGSRGRRLNIA